MKPLLFLLCILSLLFILVLPVSASFLLSVLARGQYGGDVFSLAAHRDIRLLNDSTVLS